MFYKYEIINNGKEDILYLYLDTKYEFSKELINNDIEDLNRRTFNFINSNNIKFKGKKVYLIVNDIVVKVLNIEGVLNKSNDTGIFSPDIYMINLKLDDNSFCEVSLRNYLLSILLYNYNLKYEDEVYKCLIVLYNGYIFKLMKEDGYLSSDNYYLSYYNLDYYKNLYLNYDSIINKFNNLIDLTAGQFLSYNHNFILPFIHYSNGGKTLTNKEYPYLSSVKSLWDLLSPNYVQSKTFSFKQLSKILNVDVNYIKDIKICHKDICKMLKIHDKVYNVEEIKKSLDLCSNNFYIIIYNNYLKIITIGLCNAYGLSLFSANELAKNGTSYYSILAYFFPKTNLFKYIKELS